MKVTKDRITKEALDSKCWAYKGPDRVSYPVVWWLKSPSRLIFFLRLTHALRDDAWSTTK